MCMGLFIAVRVIVVIGRFAKSSGVTDDMFIFHPHGGWPHKGLVVKPGGEKPGQNRINGTNIK